MELGVGAYEGVWIGGLTLHWHQMASSSVNLADILTYKWLIWNTCIRMRMVYELARQKQQHIWLAI